MHDIINPIDKEILKRELSRDKFFRNTRKGENEIRHDHSFSYRHRNKYYYPYQDYTLQELTGLVNILFQEFVNPRVEKEIDEMEAHLPPLTSFILPGGHQTVSFCHVARNICRRSERLAIKVQEQYKHSIKVNQYLNRLSDYLFVLSRKLSTDLNAKEIAWRPRV